MNKERLVNFIESESIHEFTSLLNLFCYSNAVESILIAKECNINVLGIDSFRISGDKIQPSWQDSIDFGEEKNTQEKAISFLKTKEHTGLFFEVVFDF
jgi:hypothetical protein